METEVRWFQDESTKDDSEVEAAITVRNSFRMNFKIGAMSYIERFNGSYQRAVLDAYIFRTLDDVREITEKWTDYYNNERPNDSLNNLAPMEYRLMRTSP